MNEWYARDASRKINAVFASRMESGLRCSGEFDVEDLLFVVQFEMDYREEQEAE